ncbi:MAG TPA: substrate-binding domain-containing protein [Rhodoglobus sp.]|jgi:D-xylose transport system substrate-binding protein|nr:substrate-binding domain-containing protein [Rhodoglobus sp.]HPG75211.1 substrate-binding domain-containing protein [Rhodoglobus sp.]HPM50941.1 substrate-binding domain-containing protein [Rhodoglobus sp.]
MTNTRRGTALLVAAALIGTVLTGCSAPESSALKIALLLPESRTARYEAFDRPFFEERIHELGDYTVLYSNADQDAAKQQSQAEAALASGVAVLVLDPVDSAAAVSIVVAANAQGVPVIAYDRYIEGGELAYFISFDNERIGALQAEALVGELRARGLRGGILMVNGSPTDSNSREFKEGAEAVLRASEFPILAEFDTPDWSPNQAQDWVAGQITEHVNDLVGVYAANDGTAGGAVAALKAANVDPLPVVTGQDAELAAIQRIVSGDQYMTVYKDVRSEANLAAEIAVKLATGQRVVGEMTRDGTPTTLLDVQVVSADSVLHTVVADGIYTPAQICTAEYARACKVYGIL